MHRHVIHESSTLEKNTHAKRRRAAALRPRLLRRMFSAVVIGAASALVSYSMSASASEADKFQPKVLVIATYETGKDTGDTPGELQYWAEREQLDDAITVPGLDHPVLTNGRGLYAVVSGTTSRCAVHLFELAMDRRFDLRKTYIVLAGIAGGNPAKVSVGGAVWIRNVVDADPAYEIDSREIPAAWPYGLIAFGATEPNPAPPNVDSSPAAGVDDGGAGGVGKIVYRLNPSLVDWAYALTKDVQIPDSAQLAAARSSYKGYPEALAAPRVTTGDSVATSRFWTGNVMTRWAENWDRIYTRGTGSMAIGDGEDQGVTFAIGELDRLGLVNAKRLLILRTASNFTMPPPGVRADKSLFDGLANAPGYLPALDADYRVGSVVVSAILQHWATYRDHDPAP
jgi:purine nucleoside permease